MSVALLLALGGFLAGGAYGMREHSTLLAAALGVCAALAVVAGVLRY